MNQKELVLCGSVEIVTEFFEVCINSILFQRQVYPCNNFQRAWKWGLPQMMAVNANITAHLRKIMSQLKLWLLEASITQLALTIVDSLGTPVERWRFDLHAESPENSENGALTDEQVAENLRAVLRQIGMSVTFLPVLTDNEYTFHVSVVDCGHTVPADWAESQERKIAKPQIVDFKSLTTEAYSVDVAVEYSRPSL